MQQNSEIYGCNGAFCSFQIVHSGFHWCTKHLASATVPMYSSANTGVQKWSDILFHIHQPSSWCPTRYPVCSMYYVLKHDPLKSLSGQPWHFYSSQNRQEFMLYYIGQYSLLRRGSDHILWQINAENHETFPCLWISRKKNNIKNNLSKKLTKDITFFSKCKIIYKLQRWVKKYGQVASMNYVGTFQMTILHIIHYLFLFVI